MNSKEAALIFSKALTADRLARAMSQSALCAELKVVQQTLSKWERATTLPRDFRMKQITDYFGEDSATAIAARMIKGDQLVQSDVDAVPDASDLAAENCQPLADFLASYFQKQIKRGIDPRSIDADFFNDAIYAYKGGAR